MGTGNGRGWFATGGKCWVRAGFVSGMAVLVLLLGTGAYAASLSSVVAPGGTIEGKGYAYFLKRTWQIFFDSSHKGPKPCQTVSLDDGKAALIESLGGGRVTCSEPAGRPVYVAELTAECSTAPGDHKGFGTRGEALERCARALLKGGHVSASIDGHRVADFDDSVAATEPFSGFIPRNRFPGVKQQHVRSAAYGYAVLLSGLRKGTHQIDSKATFGKNTFESILTLHVR